MSGDLGQKKVTSIKVDEDLWGEFKIEAIRRKTSVAELLDDTIRKELGKEEESA
ncbi:MAG: hypothetical protein JRN21_05970 [Nitrososphaerota archaeon]|nr:hypothetical protein [Nitrososphaerota archaeon]